MKLLIFTNSSNNILNFRTDLVLSLKNKFSKINILCPMDKNFNKLKKFEINLIGIKLDNHGTNLFNEIFIFFKIYLIYKRIKPDLVLHFTIKPNIYGSLVAKFLNIKYVNNITGLGEVFIKNKYFLRKLIILLYRYSFRNCYHIFFQNNYDKEYFKELKILKNQNNSILPGSGINLGQYKTDYYPDQSKIIKILYIGRIINEKGINELIDSAYLVKKNKLKVDIELIGECNLKHDDKLYKKFMKAINNRIINYKTYKDNIKDYIIHSHATILPSYREGLSHSLLVSASLSRPLLVSNVPGCKELINNNGYIFKKNDHIDLYEKIYKFYQLPFEKKINMGLESRKLVEKKYNVNFVIHDYDRVISKIKK